MASDSKEKTVESNLNPKENLNSSAVRFDLDGSHHLDEFDASLDEADEFLELSTMSNAPSISSLDSTNNTHSNRPAENTKVSSSSGASSDHKSTFNRYKR